MKKSDFKKLGYVLWIMLGLTILCHLVSCKSQQSQCYEKQVDTVFVNKIVSDSSLIVKWKDIFTSYYDRMFIARKDCLVITVDTTGNEKSRKEWHDTFTDRDRQTNEKTIDSVAILKAKVDSLIMVQSHYKESDNDTVQFVEKELNWWQITLLDIGAFTLIVIIFSLIVFLYCHFNK